MKAVFTILILCAGFILISIPLQALAQTASGSDQPALEQEQAKMAVGLFAQACFFNYGQSEKTKEFLNARFSKHEGPSKEAFLRFTATDNGEVWGANAAKSAFAVVLSDTGNCHVIARKVGKPALHAEIKRLGEEADKNLEYAIRFQDDSTDMLRSSGFDVLDGQGRNMVVIVASTPKTSQEDKPDAIITMAVKG